MVLLKDEADPFVAGKNDTQKSEPSQTMAPETDKEDRDVYAIEHAW